MNNYTHFIDLLINHDIFSYSINDYPLIMIFWNIFLLIVPFFLCKKLINLWQKTKFKDCRSKGGAGFLFLLWLLFAPNAPYVISDVRHISGFCPDSLNKICIEGAWVIPFFFFYALIGWIAYVYLVNQMKFLVQKIGGEVGVMVYLWLISPIFSLGVLLGLVNRWNSWDLFIHPLEVLNGAWYYFSDWTYFKNLLIYTFFLYVLYFVGDKIFKEIIKLKK